MIEYNLNLETHALFDGEVQLDESYFGDVRKGKHGRGAGGKTAVFGLLKRNGKVYCRCKNTKQSTLMPIITSKIKPDSVVYTDSYKSHNTLDVILNTFVLIIQKSLLKTTITAAALKIYSRKPSGYSENTMVPSRKHFHLFIKECEVHFNYGTPSNQLKILRKWRGI